MKHRIATIMVTCFVLLNLSLLACDESENNNDNDNGDDDTIECHELGELFIPPEGVTDPWRLDQSQYCCKGNATVAEEINDNQCVLLSPLQFVCVTQDNVCDSGESFCTYPIGCQPPEGLSDACCGEGDACWTASADEFPISGIVGCCPGLEEVTYDFWSEGNQDCSGFTMEYGVICVLDCGDGDCTMGENPCNCPEDCPADEW